MANRAALYKMLVNYYANPEEPLLPGEAFQFSLGPADPKTGVIVASSSAQIQVHPGIAADNFLEYLPVSQPPAAPAK